MTTDTALVTEEIVAAAALAYRQTYRVADATGVFPTHEDCIAAALAAVAPLIAARATGGLTSHDIWKSVVAERERIIALLEKLAEAGAPTNYAIDAIRGGDDAAP